MNWFKGRRISLWSREQIGLRSITPSARLIAVGSKLEVVVLVGKRSVVNGNALRSDNNVKEGGMEKE